MTATQQKDRCHASRDGECQHESCPQLRDGEPHITGRHCPLDIAGSSADEEAFRQIEAAFDDEN